MKKAKCVAALALILLAESNANALIDLNFYAGANFSRIDAKMGTISDQGFTYGGVLAWSGGVGVALDLSILSIEAAAFYHLKKSQSTINLKVYNIPLTLDIDLIYRTIDCPLIAKIWLGPFFLGGGGYYQKMVGPIETKITGSVLGFELTHSDKTYSHDELGINTDSFGAIASLGVYFPVGVTDLLIDLRYSKSLKDQGSGGSSWKESNVHLLLGLSI